MTIPHDYFTSVWMHRQTIPTGMTRYSILGSYHLCLDIIHDFYLRGAWPLPTCTWEMFASVSSVWATTCRHSFVIEKSWHFLLRNWVRYMVIDTCPCQGPNSRNGRNQADAPLTRPPDMVIVIFQRKLVHAYAWGKRSVEWCQREGWHPSGT